MAPPPGRFPPPPTCVLPFDALPPVPAPLPARFSSFDAMTLLSHTPRQTAESQSYEYDLAVIGGGSGGLAVAKKAASFGAKVRGGGVGGRGRDGRTDTSLNFCDGVWS